jgi:hypothetical protein
VETTTVTILPDRYQTRVLAVRDGQEVLKAVLPPKGAAHHRAARTLLEGLALWQQQPLCVVLCVDEQEGSCDALGLCNALGLGVQQLHFEVTVAVRGHRSPHRRRLSGLGDFRELRKLSRGGLR